MAERTILMHEDPSKENWQSDKPKDSGVMQNLRDNLSITDKFSVKYKATKHGTLKFGKLKSKAGSKAFGVSFTQDF